MISIKGLKKSYDNSIVFQDINLDINKGDAVVIIGGSGCGKSTLLRCINRLELSEAGQVFIDGQDIQAPDADVELIRRKLGMVYQNFNLFSHLNIMENMILAPMKVAGMSKKEAILQGEKLLEMVGMEHRRYHMPNQLSGGQKQRVAIARAMAMNPEVMLFDEPTSALDPTMVDEVEGVMRRLIEQGMTSVIVTHEMGFAKRIASKVVFLAEQGIYEQGTSKEVFESPSKDLTRQFLYRSRMMEKQISKKNLDVYTLCSEIKTFSLSYGYSFKQARGMEYVCDELISAIMRAEKNPEFSATVRFVAGENGTAHTVLIEFPELVTDPLVHPAVDEIGRKLVENYTEEISSAKNGSGYWEICAKI